MFWANHGLRKLIIAASNLKLGTSLPQQANLKHKVPKIKISTTNRPDEYKTSINTSIVGHGNGNTTRNQQKLWVWRIWEWMAYIYFIMSKQMRDIRPNLKPHTSLAASYSNSNFSPIKTFHVVVLLPKKTIIRKTSRGKLADH
ncbi:shaggy-like protein kinase 41 [Striga asiatica]|uniref:Shaggy-like protein kinase 41 n=1 Tax=Striga asiatica TaxID=4170 RepID=A0A5A7RDL5_STRAF|nr:shaggy-like protein kinase 41 [Striga asiatica]